MRPYGFQSGVTQTDVSKSEARQLGLAVDNDPLPAKPAKITDGTEASTKKMDPDIKKKLLEQLRGGPKAKYPAQAGRDAAADVRRINPHFPALRSSPHTSLKLRRQEGYDRQFQEPSAENKFLAANFSHNIA